MKQDLPFAHLGILILLFLIAVNLLILDIKIFYPGNLLLNSVYLENSSITAKAPNPLSDLNLSCPTSCLDLIDQATVKDRMGNPEPSIPSAIQIPVKTTEKEYFIPLGTGATAKNDWENLISTETVINPSVYGNLKEAYFIVSLKNPTRNGAVEVRLYNVTDNNVVYGSHLIMNGPLEQTISSSNFAMPLASKLYRVQLKSTLSFPVSLENSRLKIIAQ